MNNFSYNKCWEFGKLIVNNKDDPYKGKWIDMIKSKEWKEFSKRRELTDKQIHYTKRGFMGLPFDHKDDLHTSSEIEGNDFIMPFGNFKGRRMGELSDKYIKWISEQEWLEKWPSVSVYVKAKMASLNKDAATIDDIKNILQKIE